MCISVCGIKCVCMLAGCVHAHLGMRACPCVGAHACACVQGVNIDPLM